MRAAANASHPAPRDEVPRTGDVGRTGEVALLLAAALRRARARKHWSQATLAQAAGISCDHLNAIEMGRSGVTFDMFMKILAALKIQPGRFFLRSELSMLREGRRRGPRRLASTGVPPQGALPYATTLGSQLRIERELRRQITQAGVARDAGIPRSHLSRIEHGSARVSVVLILRVLKAMQIDPVKFFGHIRLHEGSGASAAAHGPAPRAGARGARASA
jgi:transcriptional regulator with XRE-family HTH domain